MHERQNAAAMPPYSKNRFDLMRLTGQADSRFGSPCQKLFDLLQFREHPPGRPAFARNKSAGHSVALQPSTLRVGLKLQQIAKFFVGRGCGRFHEPFSSIHHKLVEAPGGGDHDHVVGASERHRRPEAAQRALHAHERHARGRDAGIDERKRHRNEEDRQ